MKKLLLFTVICIPVFYIQSASPTFIPDSEQEQKEMMDKPYFLVSAGIGLGGSSNKKSNYSIPFGVESEYLSPKTHIGLSAGIGIVEDFSSLASEKEKLIGTSSLLEGTQITGMGAVNLHLKADDINSPFVSFQYMPTTKILWGQSQDETKLISDTTKSTTPTPKVSTDRVAITFNVRKQRVQFGIGICEPLKSQNRTQDAGLILNAGVCF